MLTTFTLIKKAIKDFMDIQPGDVAETYANIDDLVRDVDFKPDIFITQVKLFFQNT